MMLLDRNEQFHSIYDIIFNRFPNIINIMSQTTGCKVSRVVCRGFAENITVDINTEGNEKVIRGQQWCRMQLLLMI